MPPLPGSPVIEAGVLLATTPEFDQIGHSRPNGPLPDLGAVEAFAMAGLARETGPAGSRAAGDETR